VVIFLDTANDDLLRRDEALRPCSQRRAKLGRDRAPPSSPDGTLNLDLAFTGDRNAVASARARRGPKAERQARGPGPDPQLVARFRNCVVAGGELSRVVGDQRCLEQVANEYAEEGRPQAEAFLTALEQTIQYTGGLHGRKSMIVLSHGVAVDPTPEILEAMRAVFGMSDQLGQLQLYLGFGEKTRAQMDRLLNLAMRSKIALYFLDRMRAPSGDVGAGMDHLLQPGARPTLAAYTAAQADLEEIAASTGGVFVASTDVSAGLRKVLAAQSGSYELGFYVDEPPPPDRLSKVVVDTTRRGVRITHRRGYFFEPPSAKPVMRGRIVLGPPEPRSETGHPGLRHTFVVEVDPKAIGYKSSGAEYTANFTVHVVVRSFADGQDIADSYHFLNHSYPKDVWDSGTAKPVLIRAWVEIPPGAYTLVAEIRNVESGSEGEISTAVEVPDAPR
jgi:VWFA-related protein